MPELTTEPLSIFLIRWLQDNIDCGSEIIFDNDEDRTDSTALLPWIEKALKMSVTSVIFNFCKTQDEITHHFTLPDMRQPVNRLVLMRDP